MRWKTNGIRVVRHNELDARTAQTLGMQRRAAVTTERTGATKLWAGTVTIEPKAKTGAHHHGDLESVIYVVMEAPACGGVTGWSLSPRLAGETSSTSRHTYLTRKSTPAMTCNCIAC